MPQTSIDAPAEGMSRMAEIRRRIRDRYYDRPEVRRVLTRLVLRRMAHERTAKGRRRP